MIWNYTKPEMVGNYICDLGGDGISLAWWNGKDWIEMWGEKVIEIHGWIDVPKHLDRDEKIHKIFMKCTSYN